QGTDLVPQGRADVAGTAPGIANIQKAHIDMSSHGGVRFIGINDSPAGVQRMKKVFNSYPMPMEPAKHLPGIVGPTTVMGYSAFLVTHDKQPVELVYKLTKTIHASRDELIAVAPQLARFDAKKMAERNPVPYHPGAVKYYTEQGQWPPKQ
ncbi:MAG TPA: TAXI family TRAP transporter solute-binding subunit, partial [Alphaproteobacteria bacterium]